MLMLDLSLPYPLIFAIYKTIIALDLACVNLLVLIIINIIMYNSTMEGNLEHTTNQLGDYC